MTRRSTPSRAAARRQRARRADADYVELGLWAVSPDTLAARLLGRHHRRRGLRAALPRPGRWPGPGQRTPPPRYFTGAWSTALDARSSTPVHDEPVQPSCRGGGAGWGRQPRTDVMVADRARRPVRVRRFAATRSGDVIEIQSPSEPRHHRGVAGRRSTARTKPAPLRRKPPANRRPVPRRAPRHGRRPHPLFITTNDGATQYRLMRAASSLDSGDPHASSWVEGARRGPGRAADGGRPPSPATCVLTSRVGGAQPAARPAARRPRRRRASSSDPVVRHRVAVAPSTATSSTTSTGSSSCDESYLMPPVWSDARPRDRRADRAAPQGGPRASTRRRTWARSGPSRHRTARSVPATILRHRSTSSWTARRRA